MAIIFQDYFDGYPLGPGTPTGFTLTAGSNSAIVSLGIDNTQAWDTTGIAYRFTGGIALITEFLALKAFSGQQAGNIIQIGNGDPTTFPTNFRSLFQLGEEPDSSLSFRAGDGFLLGNTGQQGFSIYSQTWYTIQMNVSFRHVEFPPASGLFVVAVDLDVTVQGVDPGVDTGGAFLTATHVMTSIPEPSLFTGIAEANGFIFRGAGYRFDSLTVEDQVPINTYPVPGTPQARISQGVLEAQILPNDSDARISQGVIEVPILPNNSFCRISQAVIELMVGNFRRSGTRIPEYIRRRVATGNN